MKTRIQSKAIEITGEKITAVGANEDILPLARAVRPTLYGRASLHVLYVFALALFC